MGRLGVDSDLPPHDGLELGRAQLPIRVAQGAALRVGGGGGVGGGGIQRKRASEGDRERGERGGRGREGGRDGEGKMLFQCDSSAL